MQYSHSHCPRLANPLLDGCRTQHDNTKTSPDASKARKKPKFKMQPHQSRIGGKFPYSSLVVTMGAKAVPMDSFGKGLGPAGSASPAVPGLSCTHGAPGARPDPSPRTHERRSEGRWHPSPRPRQAFPGAVKRTGAARGLSAAEGTRATGRCPGAPSAGPFGEDDPRPPGCRPRSARPEVTPKWWQEVRASAQAQWCHHASCNSEGPLSPSAATLQGGQVQPSPGSASVTGAGLRSALLLSSPMTSGKWFHLSAFIDVFSSEKRK